MKKYQYCLIEDRSNSGDAGVMKELNSLGKDGWRIVPTVIQVFDGSILMERELPAPPYKRSKRSLRNDQLL